MVEKMSSKVFTTGKFCAEFSVEMNRSVKEMLKNWQE